MENGNERGADGMRAAQTSSDETKKSASRIGGRTLSTPVELRVSSAQRAWVGIPFLRPSTARRDGGGAVGRRGFAYDAAAALSRVARYCYALTSHDCSGGCASTEFVNFSCSDDRGCTDGLTCSKFAG